MWVEHYLRIHRVSIFFGLEVIVQLEYVHVTMESCVHNEITLNIGNQISIYANMCRMFNKCISFELVLCSNCFDKFVYLPAIISMRMNLHTCVSCTTTDVATNIKMA